MKLATTLRSAMATQILNAFDASLTLPAKLEFYTGTMPASMGGTITDTLLAALPLPDPAGAVVTGTFTLSAISDANAIADGTAGWCRVIDGDGGEVGYFAVGPAGSGATVEMNTTACVTGIPVRVTSFSFVLAGA